MQVNYIVNTRTGIDKNGKEWYGFTITLGDFETEFAFIDKIRYEYLKSLESQSDNSVKVKTS